MFKPVEPHPNFPKPTPPPSPPHEGGKIGGVNFPELEEEILRFWEEKKIFEKSLEKTKDGKPFTFYDGPPFATGLPHYGHILASTIKDLVPRYQTMKGRFVRRRWGWDCHGLPIEELVERKLGISGKKQIEEIGIAKFNETCRSMVLQYVEEWGKMVGRIARWVEFENSYKTMDWDYMESVWWAFKQIYDRGLVYEGRKVLLYCPRCETPVSNFEVAMDNSYQVVTEEAVTIKFPAKGGSASGGKVKIEGPTYFLAWTTTPWTLIGNIALAIGKDIDYVKVKQGEEYYIYATTPLTSPLMRGERGGSWPHEGEKEGVIVDQFKGSDLVGLEYEPLYEIPAMKSPKSYHVYAADFVNTEEGTGIVHTAVVYGEEDYELGQKVGLPVIPLIDERGKFNEKAPELVRDKYFKDAEEIIKKDLEKRDLLFERKIHEHSYPHCWRCETMLFYNAIPAWFINIAKIKDKILKSNEKEINWYPEHLKFGRYAKSVESAPDWNISRNRYWGNPMPVWRCKDCKKDTVVGSVEELKKKATTTPLTSPLMRGERGGSWNTLDLHRPYIDKVVLKCEHCGGEARRITEIFDSWMEAASMPFASVHYPFEPSSPQPSPLRGEGERVRSDFPFPAQFVSEYIAQTRAWFYVMHVVSLILFGKAPFENVVTTGNVLNEKGEKLSKSKRNFPDPWKVIEKYGVDSLRFYLMNSAVMQTENLNFNERDLANVNRKVFRILWNVYNYFVTYANEAGWTPSSPPPSPPKGGRGRKGEGVMDKWLNARLQQTIEKVTQHLDCYDTVKATREVQMFIDDLSTWYLRRSRGRADEAFFATLHHCLVELAKVIAPFMPFLSEHIYRNLNSPNPSLAKRGGAGGGELLSVHLAQWPKTKKLTKQQEKLLSQMQALREIVEQVHALRAKAGIKLRQPLTRLTLPHNSPLSPLTLRGETPPLNVRGGGEELLDILKDEVNVKEIEYGDKLELDTKPTEELRLEGLTRELERQIQEFRKESGLKIGQMAELYYQTQSDMIEKALRMVDKKKTYLKNIEYGISNMESAEEIEINGQKVKLSLN